jgi:hypothetical protein
MTEITEDDMNRVIEQMRGKKAGEFYTEDRMYVLRATAPALLRYVQEQITDLEDPQYAFFRFSDVDLMIMKRLYAVLGFDWRWPNMGEEGANVDKG